MNWRRAIIPVLMVLAAALGAGCTGTSPGGTPAPTTVATVTQPAATTVTTLPVTQENCLVPGPTDTVDPRFTVSVDVIRDPVSLNKKITVIFQGGKGQYLTSEVDATVTRSDCTSETKSITRPGIGQSIVAGSEMEFTGSDRDRVQVTVIINGQPYKIIDQIYNFQTRP
jgi:hypothetical protein